MKERNSGKTFSLLLDTDKEGSLVYAKPSDSLMTEDWHEGHEEGQLAVDVAENDTDLVVVSTMAGAATEKIEVHVHGDLLTIRGVRTSPIEKDKKVNVFYSECYWGVFSRTLVLPVDVKGDLARAEYKNGVLIIFLPKRNTDASVPITVVEE